MKEAISTVFAFKDYKSYLKSKVRENRGKRGYKAALADTAFIQRSYLSRVLKSKQHLSVDQGAEIARFLGLVGLEREYFLELIHYTRSNSKTYKAIAEAKLDKIRTEHENLSKRFEKKDVSEDAKNLVYYSSWLWSALHILLTIPEYRQVSRLSEKLKMTKAETLAALKELEKMGLAQSNQEGHWTPIEADVHISKHSPLNAMNHLNWRTQAVLDAQTPDRQGVHFTAVASVSKSDINALKEAFLKFISETRTTMLQSKEEECVAVCLDFFQI